MPSYFITCSRHVQWSRTHFSPGPAGSLGVPQIQLRCWSTQQLNAQICSCCNRRLVVREKRAKLATGLRVLLLSRYPRIEPKVRLVFRRGRETDGSTSVQLRLVAFSFPWTVQRRASGLTSYSLGVCHRHSETRNCKVAFHGLPRALVVNTRACFHTRRATTRTTRRNAQRIQHAF